MHYSDRPAATDPDLAPFIAELRAVSGTDFAAGGMCTGNRLTVSALSGAKSEILRDLDVGPGHGVGGKALALGRPIWVADYGRAKGITHHYDGPVRAEGLRAMVAVPFTATAGARGVMYCAMRRPMALGDRILDRVVAVARRLETEAAVAAEVRRRLADLGAAGAPGAGSMRDQCLRDAHAELVLLRDLVDEPERARIDTLLGRIGRAMRQDVAQRAGAATLTPWELSVLTQVATGASNAQVAERLELTLSTTKSYLQNAASKLGARNRVEAVANARRDGLLI